MHLIDIALLIGLFVPALKCSSQSSSYSDRHSIVAKRMATNSSQGCLISSTLPYSIPTSRYLSFQARARLLPPSVGPRLIVYHQTFHDANGSYYSLLPLLTNHTGITHVIVAAMHLNEGPGNITLNNDRPFHDRFDRLWAEVKILQACGVKVLGMLGGAAKGSYERLAGNEIDFKEYYTPLRDTITTANLDGIDLDIEEDTDMNTVTRLIARLRNDFGPDFLITLAPVASALISNPFILDALYPLNPTPQCSIVPSLSNPTLPHLSGFSYPEIERSVYGREIAWYNTQFYGGFGSALSTSWYDKIIESGWSPERIVMGVITDPQGGPGYVPIDRLINVTTTLHEKYRNFGRGFGGVIGWEYVNSLVNDSSDEDVYRASSSSGRSPQAEWVAVLGNALWGQLRW